MAFARIELVETSEDLQLDWSHEIVLVDTDGGPVTLTLPLLDRREIYTIKNTGSSGNNVTVARNGSLIDGGASDLTLADKDSVRLVAGSTGWWVTQGGGV